MARGGNCSLPSVVARKHLQGEKVHIGGLGRVAVLIGSQAVVVSHVCAWSIDSRLLCPGFSTRNSVFLVG